MGSVTTVTAVTMKYKGSLEAVRHPSQELRGNLSGRSLEEQARQSATQVHDPNVSPNTPRCCSYSSPFRSALRSPLQTAGFMRRVTDGARTRDLLRRHRQGRRPLATSEALCLASLSRHTDEL
jgi:hypothetical protein